VGRGVVGGEKKRGGGGGRGGRGGGGGWDGGVLGKKWGGGQRMIEETKVATGRVSETVRETVIGKWTSVLWISMW